MSPLGEQSSRSNFEYILTSVAIAFGFDIDADLQNLSSKGQVTAKLSAPARSERWLKKKTNTLIEAINQAATQFKLTLSTEPRLMDDHVHVIIHVETDENLRKLEKTDKLDNYIQDILSFFESELPRRPKRKKHELPDPSQSAHAYVNRAPLTKQFKTDITPELVDRVAAFKDASGKSKRDIVEEALTAYLDMNTQDTSPGHIPRILSTQDSNP